MLKKIINKHLQIRTEESFSEKYMTYSYINVIDYRMAH